MDAFTEQALGILTTSRLNDALDLSKEDPRVARYGVDDPAFERDGAPDGLSIRTSIPNSRVVATTRDYSDNCPTTAVLRVELH